MKKGIFAFIVLTFALDCFSQSIADVARKERERQKASKSKVAVIGWGTTSSTVRTPSANATNAAEASTSPKPLTITDNKGRDEKSWRTAFQNARDDVKRAEARVEILDLRLKGLNTQLLQQSDIYNRENRIGAETTAAQQAFEEARRDLEQARKKVTDLEDDLRRSGGPAGWAR
jgi:DNA repair exonuclease SbcCD ATPase subunit